MSLSVTPSTANGAWWLQRWQELFRRAGYQNGDAAALRNVRVKRLEIMPGLVQAQVVDREAGPATVEIRLPLLSDEQWDAVIADLSRQAIFAAQLLAGNMPPEIEDIFAQSGAELFPVAPGQLQHHCTLCTPEGDICRHRAAVYVQLGEMLVADPWLWLQLRGRERQQVLAALDERRNVGMAQHATRVVPADSGAAPAGDFYTAPATTPPSEDPPATLEDRIADFWGRRRVLEDVHHHLAKPAVDMALLRRLGPLTESADGLEAYAQLQKIYQRVADRAWATAFAVDEYSPAEELNGDSNGDSNGGSNGHANGAPSGI